jgi:pre-mRNA-splicing factor RBM22/SLT11
MPSLDGILREPRIVPAAENVVMLESTIKPVVDSGTLNDLLTKEEFKPHGILPPDDQKIASLYVSHMTLDMTVSDIRY